MDKMRKWAETKVAKFFLGLIFLSFMSFGITGYIFGSPAKKVALTVANIDISLGSLAENVRRQKMQLQQIMGKSMPTPMLDERMLVDQIIKNTTERILLDVATRDMGLLATAPYILEQIKSMPEFQKNDKFSADLFNRVVQYNGMSEQDFMGQIAGQHTRYLLRSGLESVDVLPVAIVRGTLAVQKQARIVTLKEFNLKSVQKELTEADLLATYEQNKHRFIQPEYRQVSALVIKGKKDKAALLKLAEDVENEVIGGAGFDEVAKQFNIESTRFPLLDVNMKKKDGSLLKHAVVSKDMFRQAFGLDEGLETPLLKVKDGFVLLRPEKVIEAMPKPYEDVKESVRRLWTLKQKEMANYLKANEALTKAQETGKVSGATKTLTHTSKIHPDVLAKVFAAQKGDMFIVKANEKSFVIHLKDVKKPVIKTGSAEFKKTASWVKKQLSGMIYDDYMSYLGETHGVEREDDRIQEYFAPKE